MANTISQQGAINAAEKAIDKFRKDLMKELSVLPSTASDIARDIATIIENEQDMRVIAKNAQTDYWIPYDEHMPRVDGNYLVTLKNGVVKILGYSTEQRTTHPKGFYYTKGDLAWRQSNTNPVIAWRELPEAYQKEGCNYGEKGKEI